MTEPHLDLDSVGLFLAACESGSISAAGRRFHLTQPAATARVRRLEQQLGLTLLERSTQGCAPTPAGRAVAEWARELVGSADRLLASIAALRDGDRTRTLRVTASYTTAEYLLPQALVELRETAPGTAVSLSVANSATTIDDVRTGRSQLGFIEGEAAPSGFSERAIGTDQLVVIGAAGHPLARQGGPVDIAELVRHPFVLREQGSGTREVFLAAVRDAGAPAPTSVLELGSTAAIMRAVAASDTLGVVSDLAMRVNASVDLVVVPTPALRARRTLRSIWGSDVHPAAHEVVAAAASVMARFAGAPEPTAS